jgi:hypothetical protein
MDVLVVEAEPGAAAPAAARLEAAGHRVHRCHEVGAAAFPCVGLTDAGACPFDGAPIDVALTVRTGAGGAPTAFEDGLRCALRRRLPVVVWGGDPGPLAGVTGTIVAGSGADVVAVCEAAAREASEHARVAGEMLRRTLEKAGIDPRGAAARVSRHEGRLTVLLDVPPGLPARLLDVIAVRVTAALREYDPHAAGIDVKTEPEASSAT